VGGQTEIKEDGGKSMSEFLGWASYPLRFLCVHCGEECDLEFKHEHDECEEELEEQNED